MPQILAGKTALVLGVANKWSIAYAIAQAFTREGAEVILTYQSERQKQTVEELASDLKVERVMQCDVSQDDQIAAMTTYLKQSKTTLSSVVHSIAYASRADLS